MPDQDTVLYMLSRIRSESKHKHQLILTCNPLNGCYLHEWVKWYLDDDGIPDPSKQGIIRWMVNADGKVNFYNSKEEALKKHKNLSSDRVLSFIFLNANIYDNPPLIKSNPQYLSFLENLKRVEKERLLFGSWNARETASGYFKREWVSILPLFPDDRTRKRVRAWDLSGTVPSESNPNPDWSVGVLMSRDRVGSYVIESVVRDRLRANGVLDLIIKTAIDDGYDTQIIIPADPGAAGKAYAASIVRELGERGFTARICQTNRSKVERFLPFASIAEAGHVSVVKADWNNYFFDELEAFTGERSKKWHDDCVDSTSDSFKYLAQQAILPNALTLPDLSRSNTFNFT